MRSSKKVLQSSSGELDITKDACQETWSQSFIRVNGNNRCSSIRMLQETVATFDPDFFKTNSLQCCYEGFS